MRRDQVSARTLARLAGAAMFISVFDIFKIGIGPSSSHTMGPMLAAARFLAEVEAPGGGEALTLRVGLYGSLAYTGVGHGTHRAAILGLLGISPETYDREAAEVALNRAAGGIKVPLGRGGKAFIDPANVIDVRRGESLPGHANGMRIALLNDDGSEVAGETYYSIGGGFVLTEAELAEATEGGSADTGAKVPYGFSNAVEMLEMGARSGLSIADMKRANEVARAPDLDLAPALYGIWSAMKACIQRGLTTDGELPGGLKVKRRASTVYSHLLASRESNSQSPYSVNDWLNAYAMAVNEENAAGGQVVTAPTNGAAGVIPAVMLYARDHLPAMGRAEMEVFLLTAGAIGGLIKSNASISGAEVGCQGEIGSASAMAAAGLCAILGGTNAQIENAAEIALEHHLGMTCDPIKGLVQVPCIERNGMGAVKAVAAASLALHGDGTHFVPLDACIETMRQTGRDMDSRYKETSLGGLSVAVPGC